MMARAEVFGEGRDGLPAVVEALTEVRTEEAVFVAGPDYQVRYWDASTELLTGLPASEVVGRPLYEALDGEREDGAPLWGPGRSMLELARAGRCVPSCEARLRHPSGRERWVGITVLVADTEEGPYLTVLLRDTQRMHEALELAQALIRRPESSVQANTEDQKPVQAPKLSPRQMEVLWMLARGESVKGIACELGIAEATARGHAQKLLRALDVSSQIEALARARELGLVSG